MFFLGAVVLFVGLRFFLDPAALERTTIGRALPGLYDEAWSVLYIAGGLLVCWGCERPSPRAERPGITLVLTGLAVNFAAIVGVLGPTRALTQLPLYAVALWVLWTRRGILIENAQRAELEQQVRDVDERPPLLGLVPFVPVLAVVDLTAVLVALMGGGIIAAVSNALLFKPQRTNLIAQASNAATEAASSMLERADAVIDRLEKEGREHLQMIAELENEHRDLLATIERQGLTIAQQHDHLQTLESELERCAGTVRRLQAAAG